MFSVSDQCLKERFLCGPDLTLTKFVDICRAAESTPSGGHSSPSAGHGSVSGGHGGHNSKKRQSHEQTSGNDKQFRCTSCGITHQARQCLAFNKQCRKYRGWNNFTFQNKCGAGGSTSTHKVVSLRFVVWGRWLGDDIKNKAVFTQGAVLWQFGVTLQIGSMSQFMAPLPPLHVFWNESASWQNSALCKGALLAIDNCALPLTNSALCKRSSDNGATRQCSAPPHCSKTAPCVKRPYIWVTMNDNFYGPEGGDLPIIFTSNKVASENHRQITSRMTKKVVIHGNKCIISFLSRYFMPWTHHSAKNNHRWLVSP